eukprot:TRINITY_DN59182_c0_g1_i1.p1 TRINITY_DN59182_c0_g1~~TRINITY_DN59182_c0_g1_i1.p1  ORF type:complete len:223 (+),score=42.87 TRINITY_DN59182_c0_g1_i1:123-791(+)
MILQATTTTTLGGFLWLSLCAELSAQASCQTVTSSSECEVLQALGLDDDDGTGLELLQIAKLQVKESSEDVEESAAQRLSAGTTARHQVKESFVLETILIFANLNPLLLYALAGASAFCVGMILLCILQRGDGSASPILRQPGILQISSDGERACGTSMRMKSLPDEYANFFEPKTFSKLEHPTAAAKLIPSMGNSFLPVRQSTLDLGSETSLHAAKLVESN